MASETPEETASEKTESVPEPATIQTDESAAEESAGLSETATEADADEAPSEPAAEESPEEEASELTLGSDAPAEDEGEETPQFKPIIRGKIDRFGVAMGTGRRKTAVARVRIKDGDGKLAINGRGLDEYFRTDRDRLMVEAPLRATEKLGSVDVWVRVNGGGTTGQTGAIVLGIARALQAMEPGLHHTLAEGGYLTRDGRMVERKKYGYKKARKSFQFSKR